MATYGSLVIGAEDAKKILTTKEKTTLRYNYKGVHNTEITREEFEDLTAELMGMTDQIIDVAMEMAGNPKIDDVLLVGGSSRMPMVKSFVEKKFGVTPESLNRIWLWQKARRCTLHKKKKGTRKSASSWEMTKGRLLTA